MTVSAGARAVLGCLGVFCAASAVHAATPRPQRKEPVVTVRLFSRALPSTVVVTAAQGGLRCDDKPLAGDRATVRAEAGGVDGGRAVRVSDGAQSRLCAAFAVSAPGSSIEAGDDVRPVRGDVRISADDRALVIIESVALSTYIASVVQAEGRSLPRAALEAQVVVSRSWAAANEHRHGAYDFCDLTHCQWYRGDEPQKTVRVAVEVAWDLSLNQKDAGPLSAFFHASCGGATSSSSDVFGEVATVGVSDLRPDGTPLCAGAENFDWSWKIASSRLSAELGLPSTGETKVARTDAAGRAMELWVNGKRLSGPQFLADVTRRFGYQTLRSLKFTVERRGKELFFKGRGVGHGVGFCQAGAAALAMEGKSAKQILIHYFPDADVFESFPAP